ncbi:MAG: hypothetical protein IKU13_10590 [Clostridia bacterium]|nr:hypothetical protein [Clostridia bacterium]
MKERILKILQTIVGFIIIGFGIAVTKQVGALNPWNVLNDGLSKTIGITIGQANTTIGIIILLIDIIAKEKLGIGTVLNALLIGRFTDMFVNLNAALGLLPRIENIWFQIPICLIAIVINSIGLYVYMSAQMGSGPRDSLMLVVTKRLPFSVGVCRMILEAFAFTLGGLILGGEFGIGTLLAVLCGGPCFQKVCKIMGYDVKKTKNESFADTWRFLKGYFGKA